MCLHRHYYFLVTPRVRSLGCNRITRLAVNRPGCRNTHGQDFLNDTWEYNVTAGQWTWWKGSSDGNQGGQYLQHVSFVGNVPGARRGTSLWQPDSLDYIWILGGQVTMPLPLRGMVIWRTCGHICLIHDESGNKAVVEVKIVSSWL